VGGTFILPRVIQAPIGSLATVELVSAVSNAGGLGSLALTWTDASTAARLVAGVRARTPAAFAANFVLAFEPTALTAVLEAGVPVVTFSWGLPGELVSAVHSFGAAAGVQVGTVEGAKRALDQGCDFVMCQGIEAGGHVQSSIPLRKLLPAVVAEARAVPVAAAGGLADTEDVKEVAYLGASAVMFGTRFVASTESAAHPAYKAALIASQSSDTALTGCFDGEWPYALHRVLRNATLTSWEAAGCPPPGRRPGEGDVVARQETGSVIHRYDDAPPNSGTHGDVMACCLYAGTGVGKITEVLSAGALVKELGAALR
jgi:NAD(P)H-dependent flavin oxidoreductase YrpB (nitropropane dioxygenase family)